MGESYTCRDICARAKVSFRSSPVAQPSRGRFRCPVCVRERSCSKAVGAGTEERRGKGIGFHEISLGDNVAAGEGGREGGRILLFLPPLRLRVAGFFFPGSCTVQREGPLHRFSLCSIAGETDPRGR